jgi:hypothetical protein
MMMSSVRNDIENYAAVRHRIAHDHEDARTKFDRVTMALAAKRFQGSRPGAFLKSATYIGGIRVTWIEYIASQLVRVGLQVAP